jgi:hypothetical protein
LPNALCNLGILFSGLFIEHLMDNEPRVRADEVPGSNGKNYDTSRTAVLSRSDNGFDSWYSISDRVGDCQSRTNIPPSTVEVETAQGSEFHGLFKSRHKPVIITYLNFSVNFDSRAGLFGVCSYLETRPLCMQSLQYGDGKQRTHEYLDNNFSHASPESWKLSFISRQKDPEAIQSTGTSFTFQEADFL